MQHTKKRTLRACVMLQSCNSYKLCCKLRALYVAQFVIAVCNSVVKCVQYCARFSTLLLCCIVLLHLQQLCKCSKLLCVCCVNVVMHCVAHFALRKRFCLRILHSTRAQAAQAVFLQTPITLQKFNTSKGF